MCGFIYPRTHMRPPERLQESNVPKILYLCDGKVDVCSKTGCYKKIGNTKYACRHTSDINHAKNFSKHGSDAYLCFFENETD